MKNDKSLRQRFLQMNFLMISMSFIILIGYIFSFKLVIDAKNKYHEAVGMITLLDEVDVGLRDVTIALLSTFSSSGSKVPSEKSKQSLQEIRRKVDEIATGTSDVEFTAPFRDAMNILDQKLIPAVDKWYQIRASDSKQLQQYYLTAYVPPRTDLDDVITGTKTRALLSAKHYGDRQTLYVQIATIALGLLILLSTVTSLFFFRRLSNTVLDILANLAEKLSSSIHSVQGACDNIDSASREVAASSTQHASAIEETAASMEEMTAMVAQSSANATNSLNATRESQRQVEKGKEIISQMNVAMQQIQMANTKLGAILQIISDIKNKTKIINDIVFETRLLSFNASIEAARAGVHGKGFAVVAEEVGKLANISGRAADEIRNLLDSSVTEVNQIIGTTHEKVSSAKTVSEQCEGAFYSMAAAMRQIADAMDGITTAAGQQEQGIRETNKAMMDISHITQKNSSSAEQMLAQVSSLGELVRSLTGLMINLREFLYGSDSQARVGLKRSHITRSPAEERGRNSTEKGRLTLSADYDSPEKVDGDAEPRPVSRSDSRWKFSA